LLSRISGVQTIWLGVWMAALALGIGTWYHLAGRAEWQTMIFASLGFMQIFHASAARAGKESLFKISITGNLLFAAMTILAVFLQLAAMYVSPLNDFLGLLPLHVTDLLIAASMGVIVFVGLELAKRSARI
jgi:Ca2+-transporting ATPase